MVKSNLSVVVCIFIVLFNVYMHVCVRSVRQRLESLAQRLFSWLRFGLSNSLTMGLFLLQFIDWWYRRDTYTKPLTALAVPPPPPQVCLHWLINFACHPAVAIDNTMLILAQIGRPTVIAVSHYNWFSPCRIQTLLDTSS
jgi:hypothetical protein